MIGIYIFKNLKEKKCYIGQSSKLEIRKYQHLHPTKKSQDQFHIDLKEKPENFEYRVLEYCSIKDLSDKEIEWFKKYKENGWTLYNKKRYKDGVARGWHHSEKTKKKISESQKGEKNHQYGKCVSEETKKKMSESHKGIVVSEESRKKRSKSLKGLCKGLHWRINAETGKREWYK